MKIRVKYTEALPLQMTYQKNLNQERSDIVAYISQNGEKIYVYITRVLQRETNRTQLAVYPPPYISANEKETDTHTHTYIQYIHIYIYMITVLFIIIYLI